MDPMGTNLLCKYIWLVDTIYKYQPITFEEINRRWMDSHLSEGKGIPLRTFHKHIDAIQDVFDIIIECNKEKGSKNLYGYYIEGEDLNGDSEFRAWLLNNFSISNLINNSYQLSSRILFEEIPSGQKYLEPLIEAMRESKVVEMTYYSYSSDCEKKYQIEPYCVKIFKQRWYLVAHGVDSGQKGIRTYALDRILDLKMTDAAFIYPETFDPQQFFNNSFGIIVGDKNSLVHVRIKVTADQRAYFRNLQLHHTQREEETTADYSIFGYDLCNTYDFRQELLSHGSDVEVLEPESLRKEMRSIIQGMSKLYGK